MIERIDKLMPKSLRRAGVDSQVKTALVADTALIALRTRFGDAAASQMRVRKFKDGTVTVTCTVSAMAEEIRLAEPELVVDVNERLGARKVERIVATS